jgi:hypothetical protein
MDPFEHLKTDSNGIYGDVIPFIKVSESHGYFAKEIEDGPGQ